MHRGHTRYICRGGAAISGFTTTASFAATTAATVIATTVGAARATAIATISNAATAAAAAIISITAHATTWFREAYIPNACVISIITAGPIFLRRILIQFLCVRL